MTRARGTLRKGFYLHYLTAVSFFRVFFSGFLSVRRLIPAIFFQMCEFSNANTSDSDVFPVFLMFILVRSFCSGDLYVPRPNREIFKQQ